MLQQPRDNRRPVSGWTRWPSWTWRSRSVESAAGGTTLRDRNKAAGKKTTTEVENIDYINTVSPWSDRERERERGVTGQDPSSFFLQHVLVVTRCLELTAPFVVQQRSGFVVNSLLTFEPFAARVIRRKRGWERHCRHILTGWLPKINEYTNK